MMKFLSILFIMIGVAGHAWGQEIAVSGRVTSADDGSLLPGVNVMVKGTSNGTVTNADGQYSISAPSSGILVFSFIGYKTQEMRVGTQNNIQVQLSVDVTQLSEVVITALGMEADASRLGTANSRVNGSALAQSGETGAIQSLSGKASGLLIQKSSGDPGAGAYIQIRGQSTITSSVQPLFVIDGVPVFNSNLGSNVAGVVEQSRLNDLNPNDIESVQVLKGASAAALWGSRAANGVILITTKKGATSENQKINISYGATYSVDQISYKHKLQTTYGKGLNGVWSGASGGATAGSWGDKIADRSGGADEVDESGAYFEAVNGSRYYPVLTKNDNRIYEQSNFEAVFQNGHFLEQNLSISGGLDRGTIYASISHLDQEGIIRNNSDYKRTTFRINTTNKLSDILSMKSNFMYSKVMSNRVQQGSNVSGLYLGFLRTPADFDIRDYKGTYYNASGVPFFNRQRSYRQQLGASANPIYDNPLWVINELRNPNDVDRFMGSFELQLQPATWLKVIARPGVDFYEDRRSNFFPRNSATQSGNGISTEEFIAERQLNFDLFGMADFKLNSKITGTSLLGMNFNQRDFTNIGATYRNFILDESISFFNNATNPNTIPFDFESIQRTSAGYATLNLGYDEILFLNASIRAENASTFGTAKSTFVYPSGDIAFNFSQLQPFQNGILSTGKLRVAYGEVGIQPVVYRTKTNFVAAAFGETWGPALSAAAFNGSFARSVNQGNANLQPERKKELEAGFDIGFLQNRFTLGTTYYTNRTEGALFNVAVAASTGYTTRYDNAASIENRGIELDINTRIVETNDFGFDLSANFTRNRNNVSDLSGTESLFLAGFAGTSSRAVVGQPLGVLWGGRYLRDDAGSLVLNSVGFPQVDPTEGILGDPNPNWRAGLGGTLRFKNLKLYALFETSQGGDMWAGTHGALHTFGRALNTDVETTVSAADAATIPVYAPDAFGNFPTVDEVFTPNADGSYTFRGKLHDFGGGNVALTQHWWRDLGGGFGPVAEEFIVDASWSRIRELTLSYILNSEGFRNATKLNSIEFIATGRNLAIWAPAKQQIGVDPETNLTGPTNGRGLEYFNNPGTKSFLFTIRINY